MKLLGEVFCSPTPATVSELARRVGVTQSTAWSEVKRLSDGGVVEMIDAPGGVRLVEPADDLPYAAELRRILMMTGGLLPRLRHDLGDIPGIDHIIIFGSWANRYNGHPGRFPRDIDMIVVGEIDLFELAALIGPINDDLGIEINDLLYRPADWTGTHPLIESSSAVVVK